MSVEWDYFNKFKETIDKYMLPMGEGTTLASQAVTAVNKLIYKWYNDGDVFDNTYWMSGGCNDLSSYANWLYYHVDKSKTVLNKIKYCYYGSEYEELLKELADAVIDYDLLEKLDKTEAMGSIYDCDGKFKYAEDDEDSWY